MTDEIFNKVQKEEFEASFKCKAGRSLWRYLIFAFLPMFLYIIAKEEMSIDNNRYWYYKGIFSVPWIESFIVSRAPSVYTSQMKIKEWEEAKKAEVAAEKIEKEEKEALSDEMKSHMQSDE